MSFGINLDLAVELRLNAPFRAAAELLDAAPPIADSRSHAPSGASSLAMALSGLLGLGATQLGRAARRCHLGFECGWYHDGPARQVGNRTPIDASIASIALLPSEVSPLAPVSIPAHPLEPVFMPAITSFRLINGTRGPPQPR